jgi:predicted RNA-binding protein
LDMVLRLYNSAGFHIKIIHCNGEFRAMMEKVKDDLGVQMNFTNALDHVPEAEEQQNDKRKGTGGISSIAVESVAKVINPVFGNNASKQAKFIPGKRRNFTVLQPENHTWTTPIGLV